MDTQGLLRSSVGLDCANNSEAGNLGVFLGNISGTSQFYGLERTVQNMVYVIKGDICLMSKATLISLGCLPANFPEIGKFNQPTRGAAVSKVTAGAGDAHAPLEEIHANNHVAPGKTSAIVEVEGIRSAPPGVGNGDPGEHALRQS